jgi:hypothetical protein
VTRRFASIRPDAGARLFTGPRGSRITTVVFRDATRWGEVATKLGYEHLRRHERLFLTFVGDGVSGYATIR